MRSTQIARRTRPHLQLRTGVARVRLIRLGVRREDPPPPARVVVRDEMLRYAVLLFAAGAVNALFWVAVGWVLWHWSAPPTP
jgi:hypothetical protein